ncbi:MAG: hypothetical protein ACK4OP_03835 [Gemmobacter sp.]
MRTCPAPLLAFALLLAPAAALAQMPAQAVGSWESVGCEMRPQAGPDGRIGPTYLTRAFTYDPDGGFTGRITLHADPGCAVPMAAFAFAGQTVWHGPNPAAPGAVSMDYVLNRALTVTPLAAPMAAMLNSLPPGLCADGPLAVGETADLLGRPCPLLQRAEGAEFVVDHDLIWFHPAAPDLLFMGAKHVDGTGFYTPEGRPTVGLQQPLQRSGG